MAAVNDSRLDALLALAFREVDAREANAAIDAERSESRRRSYEVVLPDGATFDYLLEKVVPRAVYHLESIGAHLPACEGVFFSIFVGERLYFVAAGAVMRAAADALGLAPAELVRRFGPAAPPSSPPLLLS